MKVRQSSIIILVILFICFFSVFQETNSMNFGNKKYSNKKNYQFIPQTHSQYNFLWNLSASRIVIDDHNPDFNWSKTESENPWCNGSGTWYDPYIIERVFIDGGDLGTCISIKNSRVYFTIRNCTILNSGTGNFDGGIKIDRVYNGTISNNTLYNHDRHGIYVREYCENNSIVGNKIEIGYYGILTDMSTDNLISNNNVSSCSFGITINHGDYNRVIRNRVANNIYGMHIGSRNCFISLNNVTDNQYGIYLDGTSHTTLTENYVYNNTEMGLRVETFFQSSIINNTIQTNGRGIYFRRVCYENLIKNNTIKDNLNYGMYVYGLECYSNTIMYNLINNNGGDGVVMLNGESCNISFNQFKDNGGSGINIIGDNNNDIQHNIILNNTKYGLYLSSSSCEVVGNTVCFNYKNGIYVLGTFNNILANIISYNTEHGIYLSSGLRDGKNVISQNDIDRNGKTGVFLQESYDNNITDNSLTGNSEGCIYELDSNWNVIENNFCDDIYEENDIFNEASLISEGLFEKLHANDDDWYRIYINASMTITINVTFSSPQEFNLYLYNSSIDSKLFAELSQDVNTVSYTTTISDYYYICLTDGIDIPYQLEITIAPKIEDDNPEPPLIIPSANFYLIFVIIGVMSIILLYKLKRKFSFALQ